MRFSEGIGRGREWGYPKTHRHGHVGCVYAARELGARVENPLTKLDGRDGWLFEVLDPDGNAVEWTCGVVHD